MKLLAAPIVLVLMLFVWICSALLYCSAFIFGLAGTIVGLLGLAVLVTYSVKNGIILLVIAFLVSPVGLPMAAAWLLGKIQDLRYTIQDRIYDESMTTEERKSFDNGIWLCQSCSKLIDTDTTAVHYQNPEMLDFQGLFWIASSNLLPIYYF